MIRYENAPCLEHPTSMFFPPAGSPEIVRAAIAVCDSCPYKERCLDENIHEKWGVWGGTNQRQRREIRRRREHERSRRVLTRS